MKTWHIVIPLALGGAVLAFNIVEQRHQQAELDRIRIGVASLSSSVEREQPSVKHVIAERPATPASVAPPERPAAPAAPAEEASTNEPAAKPRALDTVEMQTHLETAFVDERTDPEWNRRAQDIAKEKLTEVLPQTSSLRVLECRSSMCRMETTHEDSASYDQFIQNAFMNPETHLWNAGSFSTPLTEPTDGKLTIVSYLAREGEALPLVQQLE